MRGLKLGILTRSDRFGVSSFSQVAMILSSSQIQLVICGLVLDDKLLVRVFLGMSQVLVPLIQGDLMRHVIYCTIKYQTLLFSFFCILFQLPYLQDRFLNSWNLNLI